ncbi:MAG: hypothetical protein A2538_00270 [Candidatus Magasanikbacteria bacterium RIFOXYD2_FULL_41_14]|uniref:ZIP family metal transporter n=1 Tax=Candidatus Magasanikbacteria bacterium RIFOXYD2_FULL_41_14 TaxID=1798709 RepID=A0A1F6PEV7_9BACT|nr:MAG: hypothetical protein A2538_00270 [Candidatus Magasanikbacteria bacterium RIFOXYD2_FULL_41_14]
MTQIIIYTLVSVLLVSAMSLIGIIFLSIKTDRLKQILIYMVSFSAGALFGDAFLHLLPEATAETCGGQHIAPFLTLAGILTSFIMEKLIHWRHCHLPQTEGHIHPFAKMNLFGDAIHNFIDGLIIAASYFVSIPVGIATTIAVVFHEIPQEVGDFGVLLHGGYTKPKALLMNFMTALAALLGAIVVLIIGAHAEYLTYYLVPFAAGSFIYIAGSDLIPELHKETAPKRSLLQLIWFVFGIALMASLLLVG